MRLHTMLLGALVTVGAAASLPTLAQKTQTKSVEGLVFDLSHPDLGRRKEAARLLGENRVRTGVPGLIELTNDQDDSVRLEAARALVRINDTRALPAYIRLTRDTDKTVQEKSIEGIINLYVVEEGGFVRGLKRFVGTVNPFSDDYNPLVVEPYIPVSEEAKAALAELLYSPDKGIRQDAAVALGILRGRSALPAIQDAIAQETSDSVRVELIRAIYKIGDPTAGISVIPFIQHVDKKTHDEAIFTVGRLRVLEALPELKYLYESGVEERKTILGFVPISGKDDLQKKLLEALAFIGDASCQQLFLDALADPREDYRLLAAEGIARVGDTDYVTEIGAKYVREEASPVRLALAYALFRMGRHEHLLELVDHVEQDQAFHYLMELNARDVELLYPLLKTERFPKRVRLVEIVGLRADQSALTVVNEISETPNPELAAAANLAIRRIQGRTSS